jgi:propanediol dehydratase small subunit
MSEQDLKTKDQELEEVQAPEAKEDSTQIDEFKASMGDPSEVPEPTSKTASAPGPSKDQGEKTPPKQGSSKMEKPKEVGTKMGMINAMVKKMSRMNKTAINSMYGNMMSGMKKPMGEETETEEVTNEVPSQDYKVTPQDIDIKADVKALFGNEDLSEEFKDKAATIFETAVVTKINEHIDIYNTTVQSSYEEDVKAIKEEMAEKMDSYMDYVVEQWADENKLAVEQGLKAELTEDFMKGLKGLFEEHYIDIPEEKVDVVEELAAKNEELQSQLNAEIERNVEIKKDLDENSREKMVSSVSEGLTETQKDKFKTLAEGIEFSDKETYQKKLETIKESYFVEETQKEVTSPIGDTEEPLDEEIKQPKGSMAGYVNAISRTLKK